jgi:hypothetical protein
MKALLAILMIFGALVFYRYFYTELTKHDAVAETVSTPVAVSTPEPEPSGTPYVNRLALVNGKYVDAVADSTPIATPSPTPMPVPKTVVKAKASKSAEVAIVDNESDADATHIYFGAVDAEFTKLDYKGNPKAFTQGWKDGWKWASKQSDFSSDQPAEDMEKRLYGDIDEEPGQTKAIAFFDAFSILRHRGENQRTAAAGPAPESSAWNGVPGGHVTEDAVKDSLNDPGSYQFVRSFKPWVVTYNGTACWETKIVFRAKNRFGALLVGDVFVYLSGGDKPQVLGIESDASADDR